MSADAGTVADACATLDDGQRADVDAGADLRILSDHRTWMDGCRRQRPHARRPPLAEPGEIKVRVGRDDGRTAGPSHLGRSWRHDDAGGLCRGELRLIARVGQEGDGLAVRRFQRADPAHPQLAVTKKIAAQSGGDFMERDADHFCEFSVSITRLVMSTRGLKKMASWKIRSNFSLSKICLTTRLERSWMFCSSSFLRRFRSS